MVGRSPDLGRASRFNVSSEDLSIVLSRSILERGKRTRHGFERPAFGCNTVAPRNGRCGNHQSRSEKIADEYGIARPGVDQNTEQSRPNNPANTGTDGIKYRDGQRPYLQGEGFADREIGGAGRR